MPDTEKVTINMSVVDLGKIDLLVDEGYYSSRTDFIRTAVRNLMATHQESVQQAVTRKEYNVGVILYTRGDLEKARAKGNQLEIRTVGMLILDSNITPELARETIAGVKVLGVFQASEAVKKALADRIMS